MSPVPVDMAPFGGRPVCSVACGKDHTVAVTLCGAVFTWGQGLYGQLGHGVTRDEASPREVMTLARRRVITVRTSENIYLNGSWYVGYG